MDALVIRFKQSVDMPRILLLTVIISFLFSQWTFAHIHLVQQHVHDDILHDHPAIQHTHNLLEGLNNSIKFHHHPGNDAKTVELHEDFKRQNNGIHFTFGPELLAENVEFFSSLPESYVANCYSLTISPKTTFLGSYSERGPPSYLLI